MDPLSGVPPPLFPALTQSADASFHHSFHSSWHRRGNTAVTLDGVLLKHMWYGLDSGRIYVGSSSLAVEDDIPKDEAITDYFSILTLPVNTNVLAVFIYSLIIYWSLLQ